MKTKKRVIQAVAITLWSLVCVIGYYYGALRRWEWIMPLYLTLSTCLAFAYLVVQSPAVKITDRDIENRKRPALWETDEKTHKMLSKCLLWCLLPLLLSFLSDYLLIVLDWKGLFDYFI